MSWNFLVFENFPYSINDDMMNYAIYDPHLHIDLVERIK